MSYDLVTTVRANGCSRTGRAIWILPSTPGMIDYDHDDEACYGYYLMSLTVTWSFYSAHNDNPYTVHITESRHELQPSELLHSELSNSNRGSHVSLLRTTTGLLTCSRDLVRIRSSPSFITFGQVL